MLCPVELQALKRKSLERETGFEPATYGLEGHRSSQLSYSRPTNNQSGRGERIRTFDPLLPKQVR